MKIRKLSLNAVALRCLALVAMVLDHLWATVVPGNLWMTVAGRLAFPIFAFQAVEGYTHTSNFSKYIRRLLLFGLISEIPFNLIISGSWFYPFHQNVMFTLALGLPALRGLDRAVQAKAGADCALGILSTLFWCVLGTITVVDYGGYGVMTVLLFGLCRHLPYRKLFQLVGLAGIHVFLMEGMMIPLLGTEFPLQGFALLALVPIWLYNGEKGPRTKWVQWGSYLFYPLHMLILYGIAYFL